MLGTRLDVRPYERQRRSAVLELSAFSQWTHKHLDWYNIGQWLDQGRGQLFLAWHGAELVGYIGLSRPIEGCCWIQLLCLRDGRMPGLVVNELWERAEAHCRRSKIRHVAMLMVTNWLATYLGPIGFKYADEVITMSHIGSRRPALPDFSVAIRAAEPHDVPGIAEVDRLAFPALWRMTPAEIWQALRISTHADVAVLADQVLAYQFGTRHKDVAHLARLAVRPDHQRKGIGTGLLHQFLGECERLPVETVSVNTQLSNAPSQELYQRSGFFRNNSDLELWSKRIA
ncbi:MAG: GNAT family N-acetyltransferase [Chloroflexi bacterium]|nr:GNAT family N-acetyltransferase [Chloroflexota bacterium]